MPGMESPCTRRQIGNPKAPTDRDHGVRPRRSEDDALGTRNISQIEAVFAGRWQFDSYFLAGKQTLEQGGFWARDDMRLAVAILQSNVIAHSNGKLCGLEARASITAIDGQANAAIQIGKLCICLRLIDCIDCIHVDDREARTRVIDELSISQTTIAVRVSPGFRHEEIRMRNELKMPLDRGTVRIVRGDTCERRYGESECQKTKQGSRASRGPRRFGLSPGSL